jgi:hypothetical protein
MRTWLVIFGLPVFGFDDVVELFAHPDGGVDDEEAHGAHHQEIHEPIGVKEGGEGLPGFQGAGFGFMDHVAGKGGAGALMALGADVSMAADGVQRGVVMGDGGNGLTPVALAAGEVAPAGVDVVGLLRVAFQAGPHFIEFDPPMGISQKAAYPEFRTLGTIREGGPEHPGDAHKRAQVPRLSFVFFIIPGRALTLFVAPQRGAHFFLGRGRRG